MCGKTRRLKTHTSDRDNLWAFLHLCRGPPNAHTFRFSLQVMESIMTPSKDILYPHLLL